MLTLSMLKGFLYPFGARERSLAIFHTSMDESSDETKKKVFAVGALIGSDVQWAWLEEQWNRVLVRAGIAYFRTADCTGVDGQFLKFRKDATKQTQEEQASALEIRNELIDIIIDSRLSGIGVAVDMPAFHRIADTPQKLEAFGGDPYYHCYITTMTEIGVLLKNDLPEDYSAFGFDETEEHRDELIAVYKDFKHKNPDLASRMTTLAPFDDRLFIPIQAADIVASAVRRFATWEITEVGEKPREWTRLEQSRTHTMGIVRVCDEPCLKKYLQDNGFVC
jgi:hypothetical protein